MAPSTTSDAFYFGCHYSVYLRQRDVILYQMGCFHLSIAAESVRADNQRSLRTGFLRIDTAELTIQQLLVIAAALRLDLECCV